MTDEQSEILKFVGNNVRIARKKSGISQEDLANRTSLHRTFVSSVERGEKNISILNLYKIAEELKVDVCSLLALNHGGEK